MTELPDEVVTEAERLTRLARRATVDEEATVYRERRDDLLAEHGFRARLREADDTLVLHPDEWMVDGVVQFDSIDDTERAVERSLSGPGETEAWETVEAHNADLVSSVETDHGPVHAANVRALADFMGNHYKRRIETATADELAEFLTEYYRRNAWPSDAQVDVVKESVRVAFEAAGVEPPELGSLSGSLR
jgi:hypothetical protein